LHPVSIDWIVALQHKVSIPLRVSPCHFGVAGAANSTYRLEGTELRRLTLESRKHPQFLQVLPQISWADMRHPLGNDRLYPASE
jgi:hypothetical protein